MLKKIILPILFLVIGSGIAYVLVISKKPVETTPPEVKPIPVDVISPSRQTYQFVVESQGTIRAKSMASIAPEVQGKIKSIHEAFSQGGTIPKGEPIIEIDSIDYALILKRSEANLTQAQAGLEIEKSMGLVAKQEWDELGSKEPASDLTLRIPQLREAQAKLAAAEADYEQAKLNIQRCRIVLDTDVIVSQKLADVGQFVRPGEPIAQVYATDVFEVRLPVRLSDLEYLSVPLGDSIKNSNVSVDLIGFMAGDEYLWPAKVVRLDPEVDASSRMATLLVHIENPLDISDPGPAPAGLFVRANIHGNSVDNVMKVPKKALRSQDELYVVDSSESLQIREVEILQSTGEYLIVNPTLLPGDRIVVSVLGVFIPGQKAQIVGSSQTNL